MAHQYRDPTPSSSRYFPAMITNDIMISISPHDSIGHGGAFAIEEAHELAELKEVSGKPKLYS